MSTLLTHRFHLLILNNYDSYIFVHWQTSAFTIFRFVFNFLFFYFFLSCEPVLFPVVLSSDLSTEKTHLKFFEEVAANTLSQCEALWFVPCSQNRFFKMSNYQVDK